MGTLRNSCSLTPLSCHLISSHTPLSYPPIVSYPHIIPSYHQGLDPINAPPLLQQNTTPYPIIPYYTHTHTHTHTHTSR